MTTTRRATRWSSALLLVLLAAACGAKEAVQSDGSELVTGGGSSASDTSATAGSYETTAAGSGAPSSVADGGSTSTATGSADPSSSVVGNGGGSASQGGSGGNTAGSGSNNGGSGSNNTGSPPPASPTTQTISFAPIAGGWVYGETRTLSARASSGLPVSISASGACQATNAALGLVQATDVGECRVTASQPGGAGVQPATPVTQSAQIGKATPTIQFSGTHFEHPRHPFSVPLNATATGGATVSYRVTSTEQLCSVEGSSLNVPDTQGLPQDCVVEAYVAGDARFEAASVAATFTIDPTIIKFTSSTGVTSDGTTASFSVSLNRVWGIDIGVCDGSYDSKSGSDHYTISVALSALPVPCVITVSTAQPDAATTVDQLRVELP